MAEPAAGAAPDPFDALIGSFKGGSCAAFAFDRDFRDCGYQMVP